MTSGNCSSYQVTLFSFEIKFQISLSIFCLFTSNSFSILSFKDVTFSLNAFASVLLLLILQFKSSNLFSIPSISCPNFSSSSFKFFKLFSDFTSSASASDSLFFRSATVSLSVYTLFVASVMSFSSFVLSSLLLLSSLSVLDFSS